MHNDKFFKNALWNSAICCNYTYTWKGTSNQCRDCHIFSFCVLPSGSSGVRFPKERIRKGLKGSLRVSLTHSLRQSEKYGAGGEVTFFNFASNRSKWTKKSESAFFFQFKCRKVLQKNWRWFSFYNIKTMVWSSMATIFAQNHNCNHPQSTLYSSSSTILLIRSGGLEVGGFNVTLGPKLLHSFSGLTLINYRFVITFKSYI